MGLQTGRIGQDKDFTRAVVAVWAIQMAATASGTFITVLPRVMAASGIAILWHGWIMAAYTVAMTASFMFGGRLIEKRGFGPALLLGSMLGLSGGLTYILGLQNLGLMFLARALHGAGIGMVSLCAVGYIMGVSPPDMRGRTIGIVNSPSFIAIAMSPFVAEWLLNLHRNWVLFLVAGGMCLVPMLSYRRVSKGEHGAKPANARSGVAFDSADWCLVIFLVLFAFITNLATVLLPILTGKIEGWALSVFFVTYGVSAFIARAFLERILYSRFNALTVGSLGCFTALSTVGFYWASNWQWYMVLGAVYGFAHGVFYPGIIQLLTDGTPAESLTARMGRVTGTTVAGGIFGQLAAGGVATLMGIEKSMLVMGSLIFAAQIVLIYFAQRFLRKKGSGLV